MAVAPFALDVPSIVIHFCGAPAQRRVGVCDALVAPDVVEDEGKNALAATSRAAHLRSLKAYRDGMCNFRYPIML